MMTAGFARWGLAAGAFMLLAQGCTDVRPLYGTSGDTYSSSVAGQLSDISIPEPRTRIEQLVRNDLLSAMSPPGSGGSGQYKLLLKPSESLFAAVIESDSEVSRRTYRLSMSYILHDEVARKQIFTGKTFSEVSYGRITSEFANLQAKTDAQERAAGEVSENIRTRLAAFFATREN